MRNWRQEEQLLLEIFISRNECPDISFFFFQQLPLGITRLRLTLSLTSSSVTPTQACPPSLWSSFLLVPGSSIFSSCPSSALCLQADHHELSLWCTLFQSCPSSSVLMKIFSSATSKYPSLLNNKHTLTYPSPRLSYRMKKINKKKYKTAVTHDWSALLDITQNCREKSPSECCFFLLFFLLSFSSQSIIKCCIKPGTGRVTFYFSGFKRIGLRPPLPEELPLKETQFSLKKADWSATLSHRPSLSLLFSFSPFLSSCVHWVVPPAWTKDDYTNLSPRKSRHFISFQTKSQWWVMSL